MPIEPSAGKLVPVVFLRRFTTLVGREFDFATLPVDIRPYDQLRLTYWRGLLVGEGPNLRLQGLVETSMDRDTWHEADLISSLDSGETQTTLDLSRRWLRVVLRLFSDSATVEPSTTCWCQGFLVRRQR